MTSFKRWFGAGAIVLVALALIACPSMVPKVTNEIPDMQFAAGATAAKTVNLASYFNVDRNAKYEATSSDTAVAAASVKDATLTVTPKGPGTANVTVTASKNGSDPVSQSISVTVAEPDEPDEPEPVVPPPVNKPPAAVAGISRDVIVQVGGDAKMVDLSAYFTDPEGDSLVYTADSSNDMIAMVDVSTSMLTVTAVAAGEAMIDVTASDGTNEVSISLMVTVSAMPVTPDPPVVNASPTATAISDLSLTVGDTEGLDLSMYFTDADPLTYTAMSDVRKVATVSPPDGAMTTVTAVAVGRAMITVAADDGTNDAVSEMFYVTVTEAPNKPPQRKPGQVLANLKIEMAAGNTPIPLSDYFEDPDGRLLFFKVVTDNEDVIDVHSVPATNSEPASGSLDGTDDDATTLIIEPLSAGTAKVTVTVVDVDNADYVDEFMVTVTAADTNEGPMIENPGTFPGMATGDYAAFVGLDDASRFKSTDTMSKTLTINLATVFNDSNIDGGARTSGDSWTFEAMSTNTDAVTVMLQSTGNSAIPDEHNVVITPVGSGDATIYFKVTDSFGKIAGGMGMEGAFFDVKVNNAPVPYSGEGDARKSLSTDDDYMLQVALFETTPNIVLVDDQNTMPAEGYFSDKDGDDALECRLISQTGESAVFELNSTRNGFTLAGVKDKKGRSTFTVRCFDQVGGSDFESADDTLTVDVAYLQSIQ